MLSEAFLDVIGNGSQLAKDFHIVRRYREVICLCLVLDAGLIIRTNIKGTDLLTYPPCETIRFTSLIPTH